MKNENENEIKIENHEEIKSVVQELVDEYILPSEEEIELFKKGY